MLLLCHWTLDWVLSLVRAVVSLELGWTSEGRVAQSTLTGAAHCTVSRMGKLPARGGGTNYNAAANVCIDHSLVSTN